MGSQLVLTTQLTPPFLGSQGWGITPSRTQSPMQSSKLALWENWMRMAHVLSFDLLGRIGVSSYCSLPYSYCLHTNLPCQMWVCWISRGMILWCLMQQENASWVSTVWMTWGPQESTMLLKAGVLLRVRNALPNFSQTLRCLLWRRGGTSLKNQRRTKTMMSHLGGKEKPPLPWINPWKVSISVFQMQLETKMWLSFRDWHGLVAFQWFWQWVVSSVVFKFVIMQPWIVVLVLLFQALYCGHWNTN